VSTENPTVAELFEMPSLAMAVPASNIPSLLGQLEGLRAVLLARLINAGASALPTSLQVPTGSQNDRLLTPAEAAGRMGVKTRWLYQHHRTLPFARKLSRRVLRFDEAGLYRWLAHRHA
jgi:predicted DNA-binding transcriptional regulator AlpA